MKKRESWKIAKTFLFALIWFVWLIKCWKMPKGNFWWKILAANLLSEIWYFFIKKNLSRHSPMKMWPLFSFHHSLAFSRLSCCFRCWRKTFFAPCTKLISRTFMVFTFLSLSLLLTNFFTRLPTFHLATTFYSWELSIIILLIHFSLLSISHLFKKFFCCIFVNSDGEISAWQSSVFAVQNVILSLNVHILE